MQRYDHIFQNVSVDVSPYAKSINRLKNFVQAYYDGLSAIWAADRGFFINPTPVEGGSPGSGTSASVTSFVQTVKSDLTNVQEFLDALTSGGTSTLQTFKDFVDK